MKNFICHFLAITITCSASEISLSNHNLSEIDKTVEELLSLTEVPGAALGIIVDGKIIFAKGYGIRNKERHLPVTTKTVFPIGSATKAFTSFLLGQLVDDRILNWDDRVSDHIPYFKLKDPHTTYSITIRDYLTHTSGYPCHEAIWYNQTYSRSDIIQKLRFLDPIYSHREKFFYQNIGYMIAGHVAETSMHQSYESLVEERIFKPLGMNHSTFSLSDMQKMENFALSYSDDKGPTSFIDPSTIAPAGGLNSNLEDLLRWVKLLLNNGDGLLESSTFSEMIRPQVVSNLICNGRYGLENEILMESYGLGWILLSYRGHFLALHGGNINGFSSSILFLPNTGIGIVILCNKHISPFPFILSSLLVDQLLGLPFIDWTKKYKEINDFSKEEFVRAKEDQFHEKSFDTEPSHPILDYIGTYSHPGYGRMELRLIKGKLTAFYNNLNLPLDHWNYDVFEISKESSFPILKGIKLTFMENSYGDIKAISIPWEPQLQGIIFMKEKDQALLDKSYLTKFIGSYSYLGFTINVEDAGAKLIVKAFGQPPYELYPERHNLFKVKDLEGCIVEFLTNELGTISAIQMTMPNNTTYTARKI